VADDAFQAPVDDERGLTAGARQLELGLEWRHVGPAAAAKAVVVPL
jgi:hypothetical protein